MRYMLMYIQYINLPEKTFIYCFYKLFCILKNKKHEKKIGVCMLQDNLSWHSRLLFYSYIIVISLQH